MDGERTRIDNPLGGIGEGENALGMHVLAKYIIDVLKNNGVVEHGWSW